MITLSLFAIIFVFKGFVNAQDYDYDAPTCWDSFLFQCQNGDCLDFNKQCDCKPDCADGSDETNCELDLIQKFKCKTNDKCVDINQKCNCWWDCPDGSDEEGCDASECFPCGDSKPYNRYHRCNCIKDCEDGADEANCDGDVNDQRYMCESGECIHKMGRCNFSDDCLDESDEKDCGVVLECFECESIRYAEIVYNEYCESGATEDMKRVRCYENCQIEVVTEPTIEGVQTKVRRGCPDLKGPPGEAFENRCFDMQNADDVSALIPEADKFPRAEGKSAFKIRMCDRSLCNKMESSEPALCEELTEDEYEDVGLLKTNQLFGNKCDGCNVVYSMKLTVFALLSTLLYILQLN